MSKIIIKHLKGTKANQVESIDLPIGEILFGRDPSSQVVFNSDIDNIVGSAHIKITSNEDGSFTLIDLNSLNGSFVNGVKVAGNIPTPIVAGDIVQLCPGGPEFIFDLELSTENISPKTSIVETVAPAIQEHAAHIDSNSSIASVGHGAVERLVQLFSSFKAKMSEKDPM